MSQEPSNNKPPKVDRLQLLATSVGLVICFVCMVVLYCLAETPFASGFGVLVLFLLISLLMLCQEDSTIQQQKSSRREHRRHLARKKEKANFEAQLRKPNFETRLRAYTKTAEKFADDEPESQMEFWERNEEYSRTPTRPIELIRYLLQRISKLVGNG